MPWLGQVPARQKLCLGCPTRLHSAWPGQKRRAQEEAKPIIMQRETKGKSRRSRCDFPKPVTTYHAAPTETSKNAQSWRFRPFFPPCRDGLLIWRRQNRTKRWAVFFSCSSAPQFHHLDTRHISWSGVDAGLGVRLKTCRDEMPNIEAGAHGCSALIAATRSYLFHIQSQCEGCGTGSVSDV